MTALTRIDHRRSETGEPTLCLVLERLIVNRELDELETEILANPGPLQTPDHR
jgi:hypothetical protein